MHHIIRVKIKVPMINELQRQNTLLLSVISKRLLNVNNLNLLHGFRMHSNQMSYRFYLLLFYILAQHSKYLTIVDNSKHELLIFPFLVLSIYIACKMISLIDFMSTVLSSYRKMYFKFHLRNTQQTMISNVGRET